MHSADEGRSFGIPREFRPTANLEHNAMNPLLLGRSVVLPYVDFGDALNGARIAVVTTRDFGKSWGTPFVAADVPRPRPGNSHWAAAGASIFGAIASGTTNARTVSVVSSSDGTKWQQPVRVSHPDAQAFRPAIAASSAGHIGVAWLEEEAGCTRIWFTASTDRGRSFAAPVLVSEDLSCGDTEANAEAFQRWPHGGDYFGMAASGDTFLIIWPDARGGTFQLYSATATIVPSPPVASARTR